MARRRASMREGPLAELFRATEAAQRQAEKGGTEPEAPVKGSSIIKYDPTGPAADAYRKLAKEVLDGAKAREHA